LTLLILLFHQKTQFPAKFLWTAQQALPAYFVTVYDGDDDDTYVTETTSLPKEEDLCTDNEVPSHSRPLIWQGFCQLSEHKTHVGRMANLN